MPRLLARLRGKKCISNKKKGISNRSRETGNKSIHPPINEKGELLCSDMEKDEVLNEFLASVFRDIRFLTLLMSLNFKWGLREQNPSWCKSRASP